MQAVSQILCRSAAAGSGTAIETSCDLISKQHAATQGHVTRTRIKGVQAAQQCERGCAPVHAAQSKVLRGIVLEGVRLLQDVHTGMSLPAERLHLRWAEAHRK